ncbi:preprotein translocase subunit SecD [Streptomyces sp. NPDC059445]|uniref:preprotein translocase subunit SecD n=1 Tax=Streptomyces sp. NPDC059445 TaxID=3346832 RepID=UPI00368EB55F
MSLPRAPHRALLVCAVAVALAGCSASGSGSGAAGRSPGTSVSASGDSRRTVVTFAGASPLAADPLRRTVDRMRARAKALGLKDARVATQGNEITVTGRAADVKQLTQLGMSGHLGFRPVLAEDVVGAAPTPTPTPSASAAPTRGRAVTDGLRRLRAADSPSASAAPAPAQGSAEEAALQARFAALDCSVRERPATEREAAARESVVACGSDGAASGSRAKFALGPTAVDGAHVSSAKAVKDPQTGTWIVRLDFDSVGARQFSEVTRRLSLNASPQNQFAIVLDGTVISAPSVSQQLDGGTAEISGSFTRESARQLAVTLRSGALPAPLTVMSVTSLRHP